MIISPQAHVSAPPSLAEVLEAAKEGAGLIGRLEIVDPTPTVEVPEDQVDKAHEDLVEEVIETLTTAAVLEAESNEHDEGDPRVAEVQRSLDEVLPKLLVEIADLEACVRRATEEAERAARHLEQARALVAKVLAAADAVPTGSVLKLAVPGQRSVPGAGAADSAVATEQRTQPRSGRW